MRRSFFYKWVAALLCAVELAGLPARAMASTGTLTGRSPGVSTGSSTSGSTGTPSGVGATNGVIAGTSVVATTGTAPGSGAHNDPAGHASVTMQRLDHTWVHGRITISGAAKGLAASQDVALYMDGQVVARGASADLSVDTTQYSDGMHTLRLAVQDRDLPVASDEESIVIDNTAPTVMDVEVKGSHLAGDPATVVVRAEEFGSGIEQGNLLFGSTSLPLTQQPDGSWGATIPSLRAETAYQVELVDRAGNRTHWSDPAAAAIPVVAIPTPANIEATVTDRSAVAVHWEPVAMPDGAVYVLSRSESGSDAGIAYTGTATD